MVSFFHHNQLAFLPITVQNNKRQKSTHVLTVGDDVGHVGEVVAKRAVAVGTMCDVTGTSGRTGGDGRCRG